MATKRSQHRRWYRWCKSNVGYFEEGLDRRRQGSGSLTCSKATASQPLKDTRNAGSCAYEDHTENRKRSPHLFKLCHGTSLNIATLNACSLLKPSMHHQIIQYMKSKRVDVLCLQETKAKRTSYYMIDSFTFYTFSNASPDQQEHYGTGFVLSPAARRALLRTLPSSSKVAGISLHTGAGEFSVITGHAPHNQHTEETKQAFYDELNQLVDKVEYRGPYLIMGDFNARIHGRLHDEDVVLGPHLYGKGVGSAGGESDNRSFLMNCCVQNQLLVSNTWFKHSSARQVTYREVGTTALPHASVSWDPNLFAQLDLCLAPRRWKNIVRDVSSDPWANVDSDHFPLLVKVRLKLGARRQQIPRPRWDFHSASPRNIREMNEALEARLNNMEGSEDVSKTWDLLREVFVQAMDEHIPKYQFAPRKPWISQSTLDLITRRGVLRSQGDLQQVSEYNKDIKRSAKRDKKNWLEEQLQSNSWEPIKQLQKSLPTKMVRLEPSPSLGISPKATNADIYAAHLEQVQWAPAASSGVEDLSTDLLPHAAPDIEEGPLTMAELIQAIKHLKTGKSAGQDNIPNELWKNLSGKGLEALLDLFQDCWSHGKSPSSWKQSQVIGIFKKGCESDPSNFRPISLLQTCYKLYARVLAARLYAGLDPVLRDNQFGFRQGRSTSDAIFLVRRLQDLVDAKRHQVLHLLFLDWSKAFDTIKPAALHLALRRLKVPPTMCKAILDLTASPVFRVVVDGEVSGLKTQSSGIRQGCTLSPLLFIAMQTVMFHDIQRTFLAQHPLAVTPTVSMFDIEFADDAVLVSRNCEHLQALLQIVQTEAAKYNLYLNHGKCKLVSYNSQADIKFIDGSKVPKATSVVYLGAVIDSQGRPGNEISKRIGECRQVFKKLMRVWKHAGISRERKLRIYYACVVSKLTYSMSTLWLTEKHNRMLDAFHMKCLRSIAGIPTTWGAMVIGCERIPNDQVRSQLGVLYLSDEVKLQQLSLLGHVLRRPLTHPARVLSFDRFLQPQTLGGPYRAGARRHKWNAKILELAMTITHDHYFGARAGVGEREIKSKLLEVSQNRLIWSSVIQRVRSSWRRPRDADGAPRQ